MENEVVVGRPVAWGGRDPVMATREYACPRTLLHIEDSGATVRVISAMLGPRPSVTVVAATTGTEGIMLADAALPDLILLDLDLPDMAGDQVLRAVLSNPRTREIPVVILSADATPKQFDRLLRLGARAYLTKPVAMQTLLHLVDTHIEPVVIGVPGYAPGDGARP